MSKFHEYMEVVKGDDNHKRLLDSYGKELIELLKTNQVTSETEAGEMIREFLTDKNEKINKGDIGYLIQYTFNDTTWC